MVAYAAPRLRLRKVLGALIHRGEGVIVPSKWQCWQSLEVVPDSISLRPARSSNSAATAEPTSTVCEDALCFLKGACCISNFGLWARVPLWDQLSSGHFWNYEGGFKSSKGKGRFNYANPSCEEEASKIMVMVVNGMHRLQRSPWRGPPRCRGVAEGCGLRVGIQNALDVPQVPHLFFYLSTCVYLSFYLSPNLLSIYLSF